jgi:hypothetical protein
LQSLTRENDQTMRSAIRDAVEELRILQTTMRQDAWQTEQRRQADAIEAFASATNIQTKGLTRATWVLAGATLGLFIATVILVIVSATEGG